MLKTYLVFESQRAQGDDAALRAEFVREKFSWTAFLFTPLWLLAKRLWLAFAIFCAAEALIGAAIYFLGWEGPAAAMALLLPPLVVAFEGAQLQRFRLLRKDYRETDVVIASDLESAERRYFERRKTRPRPQAPAISALLPASREKEILGLFPAPWRGK